MLLEVGRVARPHGLRGQVVVELVTNRDERMAPGSVLQESGRPLEVLAASRLPAPGPLDRWLVSFAGVSTREQAEALRGALLLAEPLADPGALWVHELVGSEVRDTDGRVLGTVTDVQANPASDLLVLGDGHLVPLRFVVGRTAGTLTVDVPPGLLDV